MPIRRAPRHLFLPAALAIGLLVGGCGSDDESPAAPETPTASATEGGTPGSPASSATSPSTSPSASSSTSPAVAAATGPVVESDVVALNLPKGWELDEVNSDDTIIIGYDPDTGADMSITLFASASGSTLDSYERAARKTWSYETGPKVHPRVDVNGVEMFRHTGSKGSGRTVESFGTPYAGTSVEVEFYLPATIPRRDQRTLIDSVLASVEWA